MDLLMAECVNQCQVAVASFASSRWYQTVMDLDLFVIEERFKTLETSTLLSARELLL